MTVVKPELLMVEIFPELSVNNSSRPKIAEAADAVEAADNPDNNPNPKITDDKNPNAQRAEVLQRCMTER